MDIIVVDTAGTRSEPAQVPPDVAAGRIIPTLVQMMGLATYDPGGRPLSYRFHHKASGMQVPDTATLQEVGVRNGDTVRLVAEITAGSLCLSHSS